MDTTGRKLLSLERERLIVEELGETGRTIVELSQDLGVSEATIRRDLKSLEDQGKIRRVHGGAVISKFPRVEPAFSMKASLNTVEKREIAEIAASYINDNDTIFLDGGSTVLGLVKALGSFNNLTIVTNSLTAAAELMESQHRLIIVGGELRPISRTMVGPLTEKIISTLHIDKAFMGTIGFTVEDGMSTTDPNEAYTKELIMKRAGKVILLADSGKLENPSLVISGSPEHVDVLITDNGISDRLIAKLKKKKIEVATKK